MKLALFDYFATDHHGLVTLERVLRAGVSRVGLVPRRCAAATSSTSIRASPAWSAARARGTAHRRCRARRRTGGDGLAPVGGLPVRVPRPDDDPVDLIVDDRRRRPVDRRGDRPPPAGSQGPVTGPRAEHPHEQHPALVLRPRRRRRAVGERRPSGTSLPAAWRHRGRCATASTSTLDAVDPASRHFAPHSTTGCSTASPSTASSSR